MSLGKCRRCQKTVYELEGFKVGPPGKEVAFHKTHFTCDQPECTRVLAVGKYKAYEDKYFCDAHFPVSGSSYGQGHLKPQGGQGPAVVV